MRLLVELTVRSSAVVLLGLVLCATLRHRSAALRHCILAATLFGAAAVGPLSGLVPAWNITLPARVAAPSHMPPTVPAFSAMVRDANPATPHVTSMSLLVIVWAAGFAVGAAVLLAGLGRLAWIARRAEPVQDVRWTGIAEELSAAYGLRRPVRLLRTGAPDLLATFGLFHPRVLLPAHAREWPAARIHAVLCH